MWIICSLATRVEDVTSSTNFRRQLELDRSQRLAAQVKQSLHRTTSGAKERLKRLSMNRGATQNAPTPSVGVFTNIHKEKDEDSESPGDPDTDEEC